MSAELIDGKALAAETRARVKAGVAALKAATMSSQEDVARASRLSCRIFRRSPRACTWARVSSSRP